MVKKRKKCIAFASFAALVLYLIGDTLMKEDQPLTDAILSIRPRHSIVFNKHLRRQRYVIDHVTPGISSENCRFQPNDPYRSEIINSVGNKMPTLKCDNGPLQDITYLENNALNIDRRKLRLLSDNAISFSHCRYRRILVLPKNDSRIMFSNWSKPFSASEVLGEETEFIQVTCYGESTEETIVSKSYYTLIPRRRHLDKLYDVRLKKRQVKYKPKETLNIVMVGLDGLSRDQLIRKMPKTYRYLTEALGSFDFTMHGQHGDNTFANFIPLLTGNLVSEVNQWWNKSLPEDAFGLIFDSFEKAGYRTMYSEDHPFTGIYGHNRYFIDPITTYRSRPLHIAMFENGGFVTRNGSCLGARSIVDFQFDYLIRFLTTLQGKPHFAFTFSDTITHDLTEDAGVIDKPTVDFLKSVLLRGHLDSSLFVFFSDHGIRWGDARQGPNARIERRNPFLFLRFPPWFLQKYSDVAENLEANTRVLTSPLDVYQMLSDLIYFKSDKTIPLLKTSKGISLFEKIPSRTCSEAHLPEFECLCKQWEEITVDPSSSLAMELANVLLHEVRSRSNKAKCEEYILWEVTLVSMLKMYDDQIFMELKKMHSGLVHYLVRIVANPGLAIFEGIVNFDPELSKQHSVYIIERLNLFNTGVVCLPDDEMHYCYCKNQLDK